MHFDKGRGILRGASLIVLVTSASFLAACSTTGTQQKSMTSKPRSKEYFAESEYGVKASPRVTNKRSRLPRGGGRDQLGKPYTVKGKVYTPREVKGYTKVGAASWYGDAFHGRLTANGEIYDMTHLTAAHPTMPLPSYARVTNTANGSSVIVRVNDRGPFHANRVIDLSKRAAEMLDYSHVGVAKVKVEYVGRAPLHGQDDEYLMASYKPGRNAPDIRDPGVGLPSNVMIAMGGPTVSGQRPAAIAAFPGTLTTASASVMPAREPTRPAVAPIMPDAPAPVLVADATGQIAELILPALGPIVPERPALDAIAATVETKARLLGYADMRVARASAVVEAFASGTLSAEAVTSSWQRSNGAGAGAAGAREYVAVGTYDSRAEADSVAEGLAQGGHTVVAPVGNQWSVELHPGENRSGDDLLRSAWAKGASDAFLVRE